MGYLSSKMNFCKCNSDSEWIKHYEFIQRLQSREILRIIKPKLLKIKFITNYVYVYFENFQ